MIRKLKRHKMKYLPQGHWRVSNPSDYGASALLLEDTLISNKRSDASQCIDHRILSREPSGLLCLQTSLGNAACVGYGTIVSACTQDTVV